MRQRERQREEKKYKREEGKEMAVMKRGGEEGGREA